MNYAQILDLWAAVAIIRQHSDLTIGNIEISKRLDTINLVATSIEKELNSILNKIKETENGR